MTHAMIRFCDVVDILAERLTRQTVQIAEDGGEKYSRGRLRSRCCTALEAPSKCYFAGDGHPSNGTWTYDSSSA